MNTKTPSAADLIGSAPKEVKSKPSKEASVPTSVKASTELSTEGSTWGAAENLDTSDLLVPKIFHQQATSQYSKDGLARAGDFCDSLTGEVLATKDSGLDVIIFGAYKTVVIAKRVPHSDRYEYEQTVFITPENAFEMANKPFNEVIDGQEYKNSLMYNFYCLIPGKENELPYVLTLGGTKTKAAKTLNTMIAKLSQMRRPSAFIVFKLTNIQERNDKGDWLGLKITQSRATTTEELQLAKYWFDKSQKEKLVAQEDEPNTGGGASDHNGTYVNEDEIPF